MDRITFRLVYREFDKKQRKSVLIFINDENLSLKIEEYELRFTGKGGIGYCGLQPEDLYRHLTKPEEFDLEEDGKVSIFECECGEPYCWPMLIKISETEDCVIWSDFEQPHRCIDCREFWDYTEFGSFFFSKEEYKLQLKELRKYI